MSRTTTFILLSVLLGLSMNLGAQVYDFSFSEKRNQILGAFVINAGIHIYDLARDFEPLTIQEVDASKLWSIDRNALDNNSIKATRWSNYFQNAAIASPLLFLVKSHPTGDKRGNIILMALHGIVLESGVNTMVKVMSRRPRPYVYNADPSSVPFFSNKVDTKSFYSGHTAAASYFTFFSASVFSELYPDSKFKYVTLGAAAAISISTGVLRIKGGKHFPTDVITGFMVGAGFGYFLPAIYKSDNVSLNTTGDTLGFVLSF